MTFSEPDHAITKVQLEVRFPIFVELLHHARAHCFTQSGEANPIPSRCVVRGGCGDRNAGVSRLMKNSRS